MKRKKKVNEMDLRSENLVLSPVEVSVRREASSRLHALSRMKTSIMWKKSSLRCLREGDANSYFFHRCVVNRRKF